MSPPTPASIPAPASFDSVVLAAVVAECQSLLGARVQRVHPLGPDGLALALRAAGGLRSLLISAHPKWGRICLVSRAAITPQAVRGGPTPFMQLTRSRLEGSTLRSISAPPFERLVTCTFETLEGAQDLIVEIMGRHSNLILCVGGVIVGALKHVSLDRARAREVLPQRPYVAPPQPRPDPARIAAADLAAAAAVLDGPAGPGDPTGRPAWRTVLETVGGIGPALAWETCLRAKIDPLSPLRPPGTDQVTGALHAIGEIVLGREFSPVLYRDADGVPAAYAAFPLIAYATLRQEPASMSSAVEAVTEGVAGTARVEGVRQGLATTVTQAAARTNRALAAVAEDVRGAEEAGHLREQGELILAYLSRVEPGASMLEAPGFDGEPTRITLDPRRSGVENAQAYFKRYARAAAARKRLPERLGVLEADRGFLEAAANAIVQAETEDDLWEVEQDLIAAGLRRRTRAEVRPRAVDAGRVFQIGGHRVRVGRSARENDHLTFEVARPDDVWLHARGMPGAHVIVTGGQGAPGETVIAAAASIAAYYSAGRGAGRVPVDVAQRRFVRRIRGGRPGQVHYSNERTITVSPRLPSATGRNAPQ